MPWASFFLHRSDAEAMKMIVDVTLCDVRVQICAPPRIDIFEARKCQFWLLCSGAASYISEWVGGADMKRYVNGNIWRRDPDRRIKQMIKDAGYS